MSGPTANVCFPRDEYYDLLSSIHLTRLRSFASLFGALPSADRRCKHDLIFWIIHNLPETALHQLLAISAEGSQQTRKRRLDQAGDDERVCLLMWRSRNVIVPFVMQRPMTTFVLASVVPAAVRHLLNPIL